MKEKEINLLSFSPALIIWKLWIDIYFSVDFTITTYENKETGYDLNTQHRFEISWNK